MNNGIINDSTEKITKLAMQKYSLPINKKGNVLIAMYGATIGKLGIAGIPLTTNQACCGCEPFLGIDGKYLFYYLQANKSNFVKLGDGGAQPNISREKIVKFPFVLFSYKRQIKIAQKLDSLLNKIF